MRLTNLRVSLQRGFDIWLLEDIQSRYGAQPAPYLVGKGGPFAGESTCDAMLTTRLHLGSWLGVSGTLPLIPLYAFVIFTRTSHSCHLHVLGLVEVLNVIDIKLSSLFYW